jgi:hypothetical protein
MGMSKATAKSRELSFRTDDAMQGSAEISTVRAKRDFALSTALESVRNDKRTLALMSTDFAATLWT